MIERIDDGELLIRNDDNTYSFVKNYSYEPFRYAYDVLMKHADCKGKFRGLEIKICVWKEVIKQNKEDDAKLKEYCKDCDGYDEHCSANYENYFKNLEKSK